MYRIAVDLMGGDFAPQNVVDGLRAYIRDYGHENLHFVLLGEPSACERLLGSLPCVSYTFVACKQSVKMDEHAVRAMRDKQDSSINRGFACLKNAEAQAFLSAGNTGAMLVGARCHVPSVEGLLRPAIASPVPCFNPDNPTATNFLLDVGLNADCKPENLNQFALLGSEYARVMHGIQTPKVGLLNIGEEPGKGNAITQRAYELLENNPKIHFIGNIESRDMSLPKADVIVTDGFTGNVTLKLAESFYDISQRIGVRNDFLDRYKFSEYGGVPILGITQLVMIGHGISDEKAFSRMIATTHRALQENLVGRLQRAFNISE